MNTDANKAVPKSTSLRVISVHQCHQWLNNFTVSFRKVVQAVQLSID